MQADVAGGPIRGIASDPATRRLYPRKQTSVGQVGRSEMCHKQKSLGSFDHLSGAVAAALLICPNYVGTGSNRDVPSQVTVEALGYFGET